MLASHGIGPLPARALVLMAGIDVYFHGLNSWLKMEHEANCEILKAGQVASTAQQK